STDRDAIRAFLERDRLFSAYALADLEDRETSRARWGVAKAATEIVALVLEYGGPSPQPPYVIGRDDGVDAILRELTKPWLAYPGCLPGSLPVVERRYRVESGPQMVRMWVDRAPFRPAEDPGVEPLGPGDAGAPHRLSRLGFGRWLPPQSIA